MDKKNNLGFVMMLDVSGSMQSALPMVKIDSKAFVRCAHIGDQFGVNAFSDNAFWVYPKGKEPNILTVTEGLKETERAVQEIENLSTYYMTNMGAAIQQANQMIAKASTSLKAFVLLSDGAHNTGIDPDKVLGEEPPIYIAALGDIYKPYFDRLTAKNAKSEFHNSPNAYDMMKIYNQILANAEEANLAMNDLHAYKKGSDYYLERFWVSETDNDVQLSVVWSDKRYKYTSGTPSGRNINVTLIDPDDHTTSIKPEIAEDGYCIYNLKNIKPGEWKFLIQYSVSENLDSTAGGIEFHPSVKTNLLLPSYIESRNAVNCVVETLRDNKQLENVTVKAHVSQPDYSIDEILDRFHNDMKMVDVSEETEANEYDRLKAFRMQKLKSENIDIMPIKHTIKTLPLDKDGNYSLSLVDTEKKGVYNVNVEIMGIDPVTKRPFKSIKSGSVLVG